MICLFAKAEYKVIPTLHVFTTPVEPLLAHAERLEIENW